MHRQNWPCFALLFGFSIWFKIIPALHKVCRCRYCFPQRKILAGFGSSKRSDMLDHWPLRCRHFLWPWTIGCAVASPSMTVESVTCRALWEVESSAISSLGVTTTTGRSRRSAGRSFSVEGSKLHTKVEVVRSEALLLPSKSKVGDLSSSIIDHQLHVAAQR